MMSFSKLSHDKIVQFIGASLTPPNICILTKFMEKGNLTSVLRSEPNLSWAIKIRMAMDASEGMIYLHSHSPPVCHRGYILTSGGVTYQFSRFEELEPFGR